MTYLGGEEVSELGALVPADMLVVHVHLPEPPHHRQLEVLIVNGLVGATGEGEAVGDLKPRVGDQAEQRSLGDPRTRGGGLELVAVLDQLHDHQAVDLDNLHYIGISDVPCITNGGFTSIEDPPSFSVFFLELDVDMLLLFHSGRNVNF